MSVSGYLAPGRDGRVTMLRQRTDRHIRYLGGQRNCYQAGSPFSQHILFPLVLLLLLLLFPPLVLSLFSLTSLRPLTLPPPSPTSTNKAQTMSSPVRILALCGYSQNAITFASSLRGALLQASNDWSAPSSWSPLSGNLQKFQLPPGAAEQGDRLGSITTKSRDGRAEFTFLDPPIVLGREHLAPVHVKEYEKNLREAEKKTHVTPRAWWLAPDRDTYAGKYHCERSELFEKGWLLEMLWTERRFSQRDWLLGVD